MGGRECVPVVVVADVCEGNLRRVQILKSYVYALEGAAEGVSALLHHTRLVRIESKALRREGGRERGGMRGWIAVYPYRQEEEEND